MAFTVKHQDKYSRGQLLLRTLFGWLYIAIPHFFLLFFIGIWGMILQFFAFWAVLFTGKYPQGWFDYQVKTIRWSTRVIASLLNLTDEVPSYGLDGASQSVTVDLAYPEKLNQGLLILRLLFSWIYVMIPHFFCLYFRFIWSELLMFLAWFAVLFGGSYPESFHRFNVGTFRWLFRVQTYLAFLTDEYPPFSGKE